MDTLNDQPIFAAELVPHRSLGRRGFRLLLILSGFACLIYGGFFFATGAWPIGLFFGLDFLLLYIAFRANYRAAKAREEVSVSRTSLSIRKFSLPDEWWSIASIRSGRVSGSGGMTRSASSRCM